MIFLKIKVADFNVQINNKFGLIEKQCKNYISCFDKADFVIDVSDEDIAAEKRRPTYQPGFSDAYIETVIVYRKLCFMLPERDALMLHSAVFKLEDKVVALIANSGVGKTTHMMNYKKLFGDALTVINGDKPIIRYIDSEIFVYGTPWCGKEGMNTNTKERLTDVCFLKRNDSNRTYQMEKSQAVSRILKQIYLPKTDLAADNTLKMLDLILTKCRVWEINCTKDIDSAKISYTAIFKEGEKDEA